MALSVELEGAGYTADTLEASAKVHMDKEGDGWAINKVELTLDARVPDISEDEFDKLANGAKEGCPVSKLLNAEITLEYRQITDLHVRLLPVECILEGDARYPNY